MIVGFTGTQKRMTSEQYFAVYDLMRELKPEEVHHGDCIGADDEFHSIACRLDIPVVVHPPSNPKKRAFNSGAAIWPEKPYLERNKDIVMSSDILVAAPETDTETLRSGTWATVRAARKLKMKVYIVSPDGTVSES
jgi:hypothetical protein